MRTLIIALVWIVLIGNQGADSLDKRKPGAEGSMKMKRRYTQVTISIDRPSPLVDIKKYVLITDDAETDRKDAEAIILLRVKLPLAVQMKNRALFDRILAQGFTFRAADEFWNREDYIDKRVTEPETVGLARYENMVLQFFGQVVVSTYRNAIELKDSSGKAETLYMTWASVYVKEGAEWKVGAIHLIDKKSVPMTPK